MHIQYKSSSHSGTMLFTCKGATNMNAAVVFPGIGYHCDKPLLYYSKKIAKSLGFEIIDVPYDGFDSKQNIKGNPAGMQAAFAHAENEAERILKDVNWSSYSSLLFISKSIGTVVAAKYAVDHHLDARHIFYTPVEATFTYMQPKSGIAFTGTKDQWVNYSLVLKDCHKKDVFCHVIENANHSLETGDIFQDIEILGKIMKYTLEYTQNVLWDHTRQS